jgi:hypothetical protein
MPTSGRGRWGADVCALSHPVRRNNAAMEVVMAFIIFSRVNEACPVNGLTRRRAI